ncbi:MAG: peptide transporter, partial [Campylobacteraceae bacterium]|nr:peptide transporter [Campylobacteraceae bacterium]
TIISELKKEELCEHLQKCKDLGFIQEDYVYFYKLCAFVFVASCTLHVSIRLALVVILYIIFLKKNLSEKNIFFIFIASLVVLLGSGVLGMVWGKLQYYVLRDKVVGSGEDLKLFFFTSNQTVRESSSIPFYVFANRISGSMITFLMSLAGYMYLCYKKRIMLLSLPMVALGFIAYKNGLRFTIYAVPFTALGFGYLVFEVAQKIKSKAFKYAFAAITSIAVLIPNILHVIDYKIPTVFNVQEVKSLDSLGKKASHEDYVLAWWDYGYPIRYYADVRTLVDGGSSKASSNLFEASYILNAPQKEAANMARLAVEYKTKEFDVQEHNKNLAKDDKNYIKIPSNNVAWMMRDYGYTNSNDFLQSLSLDIKLPEKTRDIYLYLPYRMVNILPTVARFSYRDLMNGEDGRLPFFYQSTYIKDIGKSIDLGDGIAINKKNNSINLRGNEVPLKSFYDVQISDAGKNIVKKRDVNPNGLNILYAASYGTIFILDDRALNSSYVQLFFFENYDKNLFELSESNPYVKIYKLKI